MPKNKNARNRQKKPRRRPARKSAKRAPAHSALTNTICSLADPFCPSARGSRWPDGNGSKTVAVSFEGIFPIVTDASGNAGVMFTASPIYGILKLNDIDNTTGFPGGKTESLWAGFADWASSASEIRIVSAGVRMYSVASMMTSQGLMRMMEVPSEGSDLNDAVLETSIFSYAYPEMDEKPMKDSGILQGTLTPGGPQSRIFYSYDSTSEDTHDWSQILCVATGAAPSTTVAQAHYVYNVELKFTGSHVMNRVAAASSVGNSSYLQQATSYVQKMITGVVEGHKDELEKQVKEYASNYARQAARAAITSAIPGPVGGMLALTM